MMRAGAPLIRRRLTLLYAGTVAVLAVGSAVVLHVALESALDRGFEHDVRSSLEFVRGFYRVEHAEHGSVDATVEHIAGEILFHDRSVEFVRPGGGIVAARSSSHDAVPPLQPPVSARELPLGEGEAAAWRVRVTASRAEVEALHRRADLWLAIGVPLLALIGLAAGWAVTGRVLHPLAAMADAAERIDASRPRGRLPIADARDEIGRLGVRFNGLLDRLGAALEQQRRFLADAEHEMRTPLTRTRHGVELALRDASGASHLPALRQVSHDLERTSTLLGELLLLAEADAATQPPRAERRFLDDLVLDAMPRWRDEAARAGVSLDVPVIEEAAARVEPPLMERLLDILVDNALRYTPRGGHVDLRVLRRDGSAVLEVADTGIGISPADRSRLFDRFFRGSEARRTAPEGSGLGLSIAQWIVQRHGGRLTLDARDEGGTLARVELPAA